MGFELPACRSCSAERVAAPLEQGESTAWKVRRFLGGKDGFRGSCVFLFRRSHSRTPIARLEGVHLRYLFGCRHEQAAGVGEPNRHSERLLLGPRCRKRPVGCRPISDRLVDRPGIPKSAVSPTRNSPVSPSRTDRFGKTAQRETSQDRSCLGFPASPSFLGRRRQSRRQTAGLNCRHLSCASASPAAPIPPASLSGPNPHL